MEAERLCALLAGLHSKSFRLSSSCVLWAVKLIPAAENGEVTNDRLLNFGGSGVPHSAAH